MQRWSRTRRKTERLIDFDGSSAERRAETIPILASLLPASFQPGFTIIRAPVWPTRLLRGTKDPRHRFVRRQWLLATIPFILPFLFRFTTFPVLVRALAISLRIYISPAAKMCEEYSNTSKREIKITMIVLKLRDFQHCFPYRIKTKITEVSILEWTESHHVNVTNTS